MADDPLFRFAVIGDIGRNNTHCMAGVTHVLTRLRRLGVRTVLFAEDSAWRLVDVKDGKSFDLGAAAIAALEESHPPLEYVERGGFGFVLCNERALDEKMWAPFAAGMKERLKQAKVFFYAQRFHPAGTLAGDFMPRQDNGFSTAALAGMRNCVAFSVGARAPLSDERSIRQGDFGFTSVATSSFRFPELFPGRVAPPKPPKPLNRPSLIVSVHGDRVVFTRMLLAVGEKIGEDWVMPFGDYGALSYERRAKAAPAPEFAEGAKPQARFVREKVDEGGEVQDLVKVVFPRAQGARAFEYEVTVHCLDGGVDSVVSQKRVYAPGVFRQPGAEPASVSCPFARKELYQDVQLVFEVRAMNSFGAKGRPISCVRTVKSGNANGKA